MRFSEFEKIKELNASIDEAICYMAETGELRLAEDCALAVEGILSYFVKYDISIVPETLRDKAKKIKHLFSEIKVANTFNESIKETHQSFCKLCEEQIQRKYKLLFVADIKGKWDSVASVYKEACKREDCEVDVVIQPVFRQTKLPDGTVRTEEMYEDYLTQAGIPARRYEDYNLEEEQPDITFISQPYESCTIPMFWPENIAKYSKLVYLPYFTATTLNTKISSSLHSFLCMDVEKFAWKIACQSDTMARYYKEIGSQRGKNVVVSGLPKWDEVFGATKENTECPTQWKDKLDGKKVFIWNTHFSMEACASNILEKGNAFLDLFEGRTDIALIWRPHPLTELIIKMYIPGQYPKYASLKQRVEKSSNMVFDDNASYLPSFVYSDALITDFSSIMTQYLFADKPILMLIQGSSSDFQRQYRTVDGLCELTRFPVAATLDEQKLFIQNVVNGEDIGREEREYLIKNYFGLADGTCGRRFLNTILEDYVKEFYSPKEDIYLNMEKMIIVGSLKNSIPCVKQLQKNQSKVAFCAEYLDEEGSDGCDVLSFQEIPKDFNGLIVITERNNAEQVRDYIVNYLGIKRERVILFWKLYNSRIPLMACDRIMQNPKNQNFDGIILGLSHTEVGIVKERMKGNFANLAVSSQDMYYQCKTLEHCVEHYYEKIKNIKYAIIDVYDYHYFNFNTSFSKSAVNYLLYGGYNLDPHDYEKNPLFNVPFRAVVDRLQARKTEGLIDTDFTIWENLFKDIYELADYEGFCSDYDKLHTRMRVVSPEDVKNYEYGRSTITKLHKENITGNINALKRMLQIFKLINPEIKIYTVIVPKYIEVEALDATGMSFHEDYFGRVIKELQEEYGFTHLDFKKLSDISACKNLYHDAAHLNYLGALQFTEELNRKIFG